MKKSKHTFTLEVGNSALIGIKPGTTVTIALLDGKIYSAPIEKVHQALARMHQQKNLAMRENLTGKKRRRFITHSDQLKLGK